MRALTTDIHKVYAVIIYSYRSFRGKQEFLLNTQNNKRKKCSKREMLSPHIIYGVIHVLNTFASTNVKGSVGGKLWTQFPFLLCEIEVNMLFSSSIMLVVSEISLIFITFWLLYL